MRIYTVGHSNHTIDTFIALLKQHRIECLADVRSVPYSRHWPQYQQRPLTASLHEAGISYVFMGRELGARREDADVLHEGRADYERIAASALFHAGLTRVRALARDHRTVMMCAERGPLDCHRALLVSRALVEHDVDIQHILADGTLEAHPRTEDALLERMGLAETDLFFTDRSQRLAEAYRRRGAETAYRPNTC